MWAIQSRLAYLLKWSWFGHVYSSLAISIVGFSKPGGERPWEHWPWMVAICRSRQSKVSYSLRSILIVADLVQLYTKSAIISMDRWKITFGFVRLEGFDFLQIISTRYCKNSQGRGGAGARTFPAMLNRTVSWSIKVVVFRIRLYQVVSFNLQNLLILPFISIQFQHLKLVEVLKTRQNPFKTHLLIWIFDSKDTKNQNQKPKEK